MARDGGALKVVLLLGGGFLAWRWYQAQQQPAEPPANGAPAGIMPQFQALIDSLQKTIAGGPQPGDTSTVQEPKQPIDTNGIDVTAGTGNGAPASADLTAQLLKEAGVSATHRYNVHQWNYYMRGVLGLSQAAPMPDLHAAGDPGDKLTADQYLERRSQLGLSGLGYVRPPQAASYPLWVGQGGAPGLACGPRGCA